MTTLAKERTERMWVEENQDIHLLNYWFYRYITNRYLNWLRMKVLEAE